MPTSPTTFDPEIAARFKLVRQHLNVSQAQMGELVDLHQTMIGHIEKGTRELPVSAIKKLFLRANIAPGYLLSISREMMHKKSNSENVAADVADLRAEVEMMKAELMRFKSALEPK